MTAGQVWRRPDGLRWVEVQAATMEPSGWRVLVPLVKPAEAPDAPPLVVAVGDWRARVHLLTAAPVDELGTADDGLTTGDVATLREAITALINGG